MLKRMFPLSMVSALVIGLSGCAQQQIAAPNSTEALTEHVCDARHVQELVGLRFAEDMPEITRKATNAKQVRVIHPNQAVTLDYRQDRLNIHVGEDGRVVLVNCS